VILSHFFSKILDGIIEYTEDAIEAIRPIGPVSP
jgi:hypothetical protein